MPEINRIEYKSQLTKDMDLERKVAVFLNYGKECFSFSENFLRMVFLTIEQVTPQDTPQVTTQLEQLLNVITRDHSRQELRDRLRLSDREYFRKTYLQSAIDGGFVELTIPDKPTSRNQQYRLTEKGKVALKA